MYERPRLKVNFERGQLLRVRWDLSYIAFVLFTLVKFKRAYKGVTILR